MVDVVKAVAQMREESEDARKSRMRQNRRNREAFMGQQDWSHKIAGQSTEFIPKTSLALEQLTAFFKRSLSSFGRWFDIEPPPKSPLTNIEIQDLLMRYLDNLPEQDGEFIPFSTRIGDAVKSGAMESLLILKIHGQHIASRRFEFAEGEERLVESDTGPWHLAIDLVRSEDLYLDPTGRGLFKIHRTETDLHRIMELSEGDNPLYDPEEVEKLKGMVQERPEDEERSEHERGQDETSQDRFRHPVVIDEFWGTILDENGEVAHRNVVTTVANEQVVIREPEPFPFWHGQDPFIVAPLQRVPHSVWHKALYDDAVGINFAINELFNLMIDGGIGAVWGIRQVRPHYLENPEQISGGIAQGATLVMNEAAPDDADAVDQIEKTGQVPNDAMAVFQTLDREFNAAALTSDIKLGQLPERKVLATEIMESTQSQATVLDALVGDLERIAIKRTLEKSWMLMLQHFEELDAAVVINAIGEQKALQMFRMGPEDRFGFFSHTTHFKVSGLSETMNRSRDFQKMMALIQAAGSNPLMLRSFLQGNFSGRKMLNHVMKTLNIDPENFTEEEQQSMEQGISEIERIAQATGGGRQGNLTGEEVGEGGLTSDVNQNANPTMVGEAGTQ